MKNKSLDVYWREDPSGDVIIHPISQRAIGWLSHYVKNTDGGYSFYNPRDTRWNTCIKEVKRLNKID